MKNIYFRLSLSLVGMISLNGCTLFFGNIKSVDEKSVSYGIMDLSQTKDDWIKLDPKTTANSPDNLSNNVNESGVTDAAYQSKTTDSVISINSACKSYVDPTSESTLASLTQELLLGISNISLREEKNLTLRKDIPALETTIRGTIKKEKMMLRTVVIQRNNCVYDLMYISRAEKFEKNEADFSQFVSSLSLK
jgi:hypothetical protein